jgi:hypothetical protein
MESHPFKNKKYNDDNSHANLQFSLVAMNRNYWSIPLRLYPSAHSLSLALWYLNHDLILPPCRPLLLPAPHGFVSAYIDRERHGPKNTRCIEADQDICAVCSLHRSSAIPPPPPRIFQTFFSKKIFSINCTKKILLIRLPPHKIAKTIVQKVDLFELCNNDVC